MAEWLSQTEYAVIGALLIDQSGIGEVVEKLKPDALSIKPLRDVYEAIVKLHFDSSPISAASVLNAVGADYEPIIKQSVEFAPFARSDVPFYAGVLMEQSRLGRIKATAAELAASETMEAANASMGALNGLMVTRSAVRAVSAEDAATEFCSRMTATPEYLAWGVPAIDGKVFAERGDLILLGGYPSAGKTLLAVQFALCLSNTYRVGFFSLETSARKLTDRVMSHMSQIPLTKIKRRDLNDADWVAIAAASSELSKLQFSIVEASGMSVHDIQAVSLNQRFDIIFVDYLQLINEKGKDRYETVTNISQRLHTFSQSSGVAVIALSQLSRPEKQTGKPKPPTMASFRESGQIEQDADVAFILYPSDPDDNYSTRILKIAKNKEGEKAKIEFDFDGATQTMRVHELTKGEKYREVRKAIAEAGKNCVGQVKFAEIKESGDLPF